MVHLLDQTMSKRIHEIKEAEQRAYDAFVRAADAHALASRPGRVILYVEDDPTTISFIKTLVSILCKTELGEMSVEPVSSVAEAKAFIRQNLLDLKAVIMDLNLGVDVSEGLGLLEWTHDFTRSTVPILVMSAYAGALAQVKDAGYRNVEVILKASDMDEVLLAIADCADPDGVIPDHAQLVRAHG